MCCRALVFEVSFPRVLDNLLLCFSQCALTVEALQQIFQEIDRDQENEVSFEDVKTAIASGELADFLESIGISTNDVWTLFMLLDSDRKGSIDLDEFVSGCMQLHGPAKSLQMAKMSYENKLTRQAIKSLSQDIYNLNKKLTTSTSFKEPMLPAIKEQF
ncbi:Voltage-dependent calcium channel type A subunit alpha-1 [Durusdinium trenchii]|uniref:Voltage-dependent calcium channel type A subunit alpha-1 n=1 Tax=Durusdinium trenchii TaxID=1381693 RepID=A0ABP0RLL7_9DINO